MSILKRPTPHFNARPAGSGVSLVVLHADAAKSEGSTIGWLNDPASKVSYHYLIGRDGTVYQFVADELRAWHAGVSTFNGVPNCNDYSIGVSFSNDQVSEPFPLVQIDAGVALVAMLCGRHKLAVDRITTHAVIAPGRKKDPGPKFQLTSFMTRVGAVLP